MGQRPGYQSSDENDRTGTLDDMHSADEVKGTNDLPVRSKDKNLCSKRSISGRPVGVGLPRTATFQRQKSEERTRLCAVRPAAAEKRALSSARPRSTSPTRFRSRSSPTGDQLTRSSAPNLSTTARDADSTQSNLEQAQHDGSTNTTSVGGILTPEGSRPPRAPSVSSSQGSYERQKDHLDDRAQLNAELDTKWILNLSMHFRDKSDREKFFVTYAESPNKWRRVTVSCDYRHAEPGSLEMDLKELSFQRDKSLQIYDAIRASLPEIQFYDTVTNLKLETSDGRLHVHVTEDVNEIIQYPPRSSIMHVLQDATYRPMECRESDLTFDAHLSGFVYRVKHRNKVYIKKEIPGPDTIDEFLYEVNALHALHASEHVIKLEGIVLDDSCSVVKGLLISYAEKGAVVDLLYDHKGEIPWEHREMWARHAVMGLSDIHEEGYVQGDFTLSNVVVDSRNNARIIDINRRGCPVGWEPPELAKKIASNQRISMYIGEKSDLYQLGMALWALAMDDDEPERHDPPLSTDEFPAEVPAWFQSIVRICLSPQPRDRISAKTLLTMFKETADITSFQTHAGDPIARGRLEKHYIDPEAAVERYDLERFSDWHQAADPPMYSPGSSREDPTFTYPRSSNYDLEHGSLISEGERPRGRRLLSYHDRELLSRSIMQANQTSDAEGHRIVTVAPDDMDLDQDVYEEYERQRPPRPVSDQQNPLDLNQQTEIAPSADPALGYLSPRNLALFEEEFRGRSPPSEMTPRNSSVQFANIYPSAQTPLQNEPVSPEIAGDLAYMGSNPDIHPQNINMHNHDEAAEELSEPVDNNHRFTLRYVDSGFNEPEYFGLLPDDRQQSLAEFNNHCDVEDFQLTSPSNAHSSTTELATSPQTVTPLTGKGPGTPSNGMNPEHNLSQQDQTTTYEPTA